MYLIRNAHLINEGTVCTVDVRLRAGRIAEIAPTLATDGVECQIDARGLHLLPGMIVSGLSLDQQNGAGVSRAAVAGGITSVVLSSADGAIISSPAPLANFGFCPDADVDHDKEALRWDCNTLDHALPALLERVHQGTLDLPTLVRECAHAPADRFKLWDRGYVRAGYFADLVLVDVYRPYRAQLSDLHPPPDHRRLDGVIYRSSVMHTFVSGHLAYSDGRIDDSVAGLHLEIEP